MPSIKCHNDRNHNGKITTCDRFFASIPDCVVHCLRENPGEQIICRCPACPPYQTWAAIYFDKDLGLTWKSVDKPGGEIFENKLILDKIIKSEQVG